MLLGSFMSFTQGSIVWHCVQEFFTLWNPTTLPDSIVTAGSTKTPTRRVHFAAALTRQSGLRKRTKTRTAADVRPSRMPAPETQRMTLSRSPENRPLSCTLLASVRVIAVVVEFQLLDLVSVLADLFGEGELHEGGTLLVV